MTKKQKQFIFGTVFFLSFLSSVYLNMELRASDAAYTQDIQGLPDVNMIKHIFKMILEPLRLG